jgi:hypothetical protein
MEENGFEIWLMSHEKWMTIEGAIKLWINQIDRR